MQLEIVQISELAVKISNKGSSIFVCFDTPTTYLLKKNQLK